MRHSLALVGLVLALAACSPHRYYGRGLVLEVDRQAHEITVSHERIDGYMEPMVMPFNVRKPELLKDVQRGDRIHFQLAVGKKASYVDHVLIVSAQPSEPSNWQTPVVSKLVQAGATFPDFELTDQHGQPVSLSQFRGRIVAVNFIYTRCPLPDYCPRMTNNFVDLRKRFSARLGSDLVLLTITIDPQFDTPDILKLYAKVFDAESTAWRFLTGSKAEIVKVAGLFGIEFWPDEGTLLHNLQTAIIDRDGRLNANIEGKDFSEKQLGDLVERLLR